MFGVDLQSPVAQQNAYSPSITATRDLVPTKLVPKSVTYILIDPLRKFTIDQCVGS